MGWAALGAAQGDAVLVRVVPGPDGPLWQLTDNPQSERRYIGIDGKPFAGGETAYARWLAEWYLGEGTELTSITLQTRFDDAYPWVNRLLPVWRVEVGGAQPRTAWLHTETGSLASLGDPRRTVLQSWFRACHTLDWLDGLEWLRVVLIVLAMVSVLVLVGTGTVLFAARSGGNSGRRWHRRLGILVALPLVLMAGSGLLHVLVFAGPAPDRGLVLPPRLPELPASPEFPSDTGLLSDLAVRAEGDRLIWVHRGQANPDWRISALGETIEFEWDELLEVQATRVLGAPPERITVARHFSPDYDFRNRRLPVWIAVNAAGDRVALDPFTGQEVDRQTSILRAEGWIFSLLHKWQPVAMVTGNPKLRDLLQVSWLALVLPLAILGWRLRLPARRLPTHPNSVSTPK